jgi:hypothetical protein
VLLEQAGQAFAQQEEVFGYDDAHGTSHRVIPCILIP